MGLGRWVTVCGVGLLAGPAAAAVPISLPDTVSLGDWEEIFVLADLAPGERHGGPGVLVEAGPTEWSLQVWDRAGEHHQVSLPPPETDEGRAELIWLAVSLLEPGPPEPERPVAKPEPAEPATPEPVAVRPAPRPAPAPVPEPVVAAPVVPTVERMSPVSVDLAAGVDASSRSGLGWTPGLALAVRAPLRAGLGPEVELAWHRAGSLAELETDAAMGEFQVGAGVRWDRRGELAPVLGVGVGVSVRRYLDGADTVAWVVMPLLSARAGLAVEVLGPWRLEAALRVDWDAWNTQVIGPNAESTSPGRLALLPTVTLAREVTSRQEP